MVFILAGVFAAIGAMLLIVDALRRRHANVAQIPTLQAHEPEEATPQLLPESPELVDLEDTALEPTSTEHLAAKDQRLETEPAVAELLELETVPTYDQLPPQEPVVELEVESTEDLEQLELTQASEPAVATDTDFDAAALLPNLPGYHRRVRKAWAEYCGYSYTKSDAFLTDEWERTWVTNGGTARDVVSGMAAGYEMHVCDLAGKTLLAMRRNHSSDIAIEAYRVPPAELAVDLVDVISLGGFTLFATDQGAAMRFVDQRVRECLPKLPQAVLEVWLESEWILAATEKTSDHKIWEAILEPLSILADAAAVLPPRAQARQPLDFHDNDPSRPLPPPVAIMEYADSSDEEFAPPQLPEITDDMVRVDPPLVFPTRAQGQALGVVTPHSLGVDEVSPIAESFDSALQHSDFHGTRVLRFQAHRSKIFEDSVADNQHDETVASEDVKKPVDTGEDANVLRMHQEPKQD